MKKIIFFTKYTTKGPSSRYRTYQYEPYFKNEFELEFFPFFDDDYIDSIYGNKKKGYLKLSKYFIRRITCILSKLFTKDLVVIEYELIPYFPSIFERLFRLTGVKYILDYDDAIFHNYDSNQNWLVRFFFKNKIKKIAKHASHIITGSPYLTDFFGKINDNVTEIPTSIKFEHYQKNNLNLENKKFVIGWLGSNSTSKNLLILKDVINQINEAFPDVVFRFCGFNRLLLSDFNAQNIELEEWSASNEMKFLNEISVGIMPLEDNLFNRGKCGFKLIQYMAMGKPTISTPLETNVKIDRNNGNLFANSNNDWYAALSEILNNHENFKKIGISNAEIIRKFYSSEENSKLYINLFKSLR